jgi:hypothetical protein
MRIDPYFLQFACPAHLDGYDINAPGPIAATVLIQINVRGLDNLLLFTPGHSLLWQAIGVASPRFDLDKDQFLLVFGDQIDLAVPTGKVLCQDTIPAPLQLGRGQPLAGTPQAGGRALL